MHACSDGAQKASLHMSTTITAVKTARAMTGIASCNLLFIQSTAYVPAFKTATRFPVPLLWT